MRGGTDPSDDRKAARRRKSIAAANTFEAVAYEWFVSTIQEILNHGGGFVSELGDLAGGLFKPGYNRVVSREPTATPRSVGFYTSDLSAFVINDTIGLLRAPVRSFPMQRATIYS